MKNLLAAVLVAALLAGCSSEKSADKTTPDTDTKMDNQTAVVTESGEKSIAYEPTGYVHTWDGKPLEIAGITFTPPSQWKDLGPSNMRAANYTLGPLEQDADSATVAVYFFGQGQGGSIESNIERWINQTALPDGRDPHTGAIQYQLDVDGMTVHMLSIYGFYEAPVGGMMSGKTINKENYRVVGAIVEAPGGNVFFKLIGPDYTAKVMIEGFMPMIKAITKV